MRRLLTISIYLVIIISSCKKKPDTTMPPENISAEMVLDSIFLYAKETWYWQQQLPGDQVFDPGNYLKGGVPLGMFEDALRDIVKHGTDPVSGLSYELPYNRRTPKFSFLSENGPELSGGTRLSMSLGGAGNDFGFGLGLLNGQTWVSYVYPGSPAAEAGLKRGERVMEINTTDDNQSTVLHLQSRGGERDRTVRLIRRSYQSSTIFKDTLFRLGSTGIGYIAVGRFITFMRMKEALDKVFQRYASENISEIVVDLRYNPGGYLESAAYLADLIAPVSVSGNVMYKEHFNTLLRGRSALILKQQPYFDNKGYRPVINGHPATYWDIDYSVTANTRFFQKTGLAHNIKKVYFITGGETASASEMLINCLKPYMDVTVIGKQTYGKPMGSFGIRIGPYSLFLANFQIKNAKDQGDYFNGILPDIYAEDDITHDFGDPGEGILSAILEKKTPEKYLLRRGQAPVYLNREVSGGMMIKSRFHLRD